MSTNQSPVHALKKRLFDLYYQKLNAPQRQALYQVNGPVLVLAGAGSGKTTVLVKRISHIIHFGNAYASYQEPKLSEDEISILEGIAQDPATPPQMLRGILKQFAQDPATPDSVLAITFTNKAAEEIKNRLAQELGEDALGIWAGTFHSVCVRILRRYIERLGYTRDFVIYDTDDQKKLINGIIKKMKLDDQVYTPKAAIRLISDAKNKLQDEKDFAARTHNDHELETYARIFEAYQAALREAGALDFDDIISLTVKLLRTDRDACGYLQRKFRYVLVDEYQDTNHAQSILMHLIGSGHSNVMVVGDDDQSIYKFRGAVIDNILSFDKMYPSACVIRLEQNYRSTKTILEAANAVIAKNEKRKGKVLWCNGGEGDKILVHCANDHEAEALFVANTIHEMVSQGKASYKDFAVLYRVNAVSNTLESVFSKSGVPHRLLGGVRFYDRAEVKDVLAYLSVINNPADIVRLRRIINLPKRGLGEGALSKIEELAAQQEKSAFWVMCHADEFPDLKRYQGVLDSFTSMILSLQNTAHTQKLSHLFRRTIEVTGYMEMLEKLGREAEDRIDNINELVSSAISFEEKNPQGSLFDFLEEVSLVADIDGYDKGSDSVVLMTVHSAKGLEFPYVFLCGMEETVFPSSQSSFDQAELEEERRLAYVAITRAKKRLHITLTQRRTLYGSTKFNPPSRFIEEIPDHLCESNLTTRIQRLSESDLYRSQNSPYSQALPHYGGRIGSYGKAPLRDNDSFQRRVPQGAVYPSGLKATPYPQANAKPLLESVFSPGDKVRHSTFGNGVVQEAKKMSADVLYVIRFDNEKVGTKRLMGSYAKLKKID